MNYIDRQLQKEQQLFEQQYQSILHDDALLYAGNILYRSAHLYGDRVALIYQDHEITYRTLFQYAQAFARYLKEKGVQPRDRILMCFENSLAFYVAYFGIWHTGAVVAPLNTFLREAEITHIINDAQPKLIVTSSDRVELFTQAPREATPGTAKSDAPIPPIITEEHMRLNEPAPDIPVSNEELVTLEQNEMAALLYTSGTTGFPKGVMLSSRNIMTNLLQGLARLKITKQERVFAILPLFHVFAQSASVWGSFFVGATVIVVPRIERRALLDNIKHKPTYFLGVPALYGLLCLLRTVNLDSVKYFISGGDALPDKIRSAFSLIYRRKLCNGYGLTETSPVLTADFDDEAGPTSTVGKPCVGVQLAIRDEKGNDLPQGNIGTIWTKGDMVMLGYYRAPEETNRVIKDGWFDTGDLGYIDHRGKLVITGRIKDLIIHQGFNIYPQEVENIILLHPLVIRVGVIGQKDEEVGEIPVAFVQIRQKDPDIEKALYTLCKQHLASYKVPRKFVITTEDLPVTATGKVDKKVLRKQLAEK